MVTSFKHTAQTSLGTTRFFLSIHLPHLSCMIPCSYWALTWVAVLPTCMTSYEISVRQTRDLPVSWYIPHIQLPSDSISRWTPLPSVYPSHYRRIRDFNPLETCAARRTTQKCPAKDGGARIICAMDGAYNPVSSSIETLKA